MHCHRLSYDGFKQGRNHIRELVSVKLLSKIIISVFVYWTFSYCAAMNVQLCSQKNRVGAEQKAGLRPPYLLLKCCHLFALSWTLISSSCWATPRYHWPKHTLHLQLISWTDFGLLPVALAFLHRFQRKHLGQLNLTGHLILYELLNVDIEWFN